MNCIKNTSKIIVVLVSVLAVFLSFDMNIQIVNATESIDEKSNLDVRYIVLEDDTVNGSYNYIPDDFDMKNIEKTGMEISPITIYGSNMIDAYSVIEKYEIRNENLANEIIDITDGKIDGALDYVYKAYGRDNGGKFVIESVERSVKIDLNDVYYLVSAKKGSYKFAFKEADDRFKNRNSYYKDSEYDKQNSGLYLESNPVDAPLDTLFELRGNDIFEDDLQKYSGGEAKNGYYKLILDENGDIEALVSLEDSEVEKLVEINEDFKLDSKPIKATLSAKYKDMAIVVKKWIESGAKKDITSAEVDLGDGEIIELAIEVNRSKSTKLGLLGSYSDNTDKPAPDKLIWARVRYEGEKPMAIDDIFDEDMQNYPVYQVAKIASPRWKFAFRELIDLDNKSGFSLSYDPQNTFALYVDDDTDILGDVGVGDMVEVGYAHGRCYGIRALEWGKDEISKMELAPTIALENLDMDYRQMNAGIVVSYDASHLNDDIELKKDEKVYIVGLADGEDVVLKVNADAKIYTQDESDLLDTEIGYFDARSLSDISYEDIKIGDMIYFDSEYQDGDSEKMVLEDGKERYPDHSKIHADNIVKIAYNYADYSKDLNKYNTMIDAGNMEFASDDYSHIWDDDYGYENYDDYHYYWIREYDNYIPNYIQKYDLTDFFNDEYGMRGIALNDYSYDMHIVKFDQIMTRLDRTDFYRGKLTQKSKSDFGYQLSFDVNGKSVEAKVVADHLLGRVKDDLDVFDDVIFYMDLNSEIVEFQAVKNSNRTKKKLLGIEDIEFLDDNIAIVDLIDDRNRRAESLILDLRTLENMPELNDEEKKEVRDHYFDKWEFYEIKYSVALLGDDYIIFAGKISNGENKD